MSISRCCVWALADLVGCTLHFPCAPSPWLFLQTACVQGHGRMPGASRWSCRISEWALDRVLPLVQWLRKRQCNDALALGLSRSPALCLSGSWTACRKAAAPSPVPCCPHAAYPPPSTSVHLLLFHHWSSPEMLATGLFLSILFLPTSPLLLFLSSSESMWGDLFF